MNDLGAKPNEVAYNFTQRRSLSSLRILQKALEHLRLHLDAQVDRGLCKVSGDSGDRYLCDGA